MAAIQGGSNTANVANVNTGYQLMVSAETASFATATTHSPRRIPLGMCSAPVGAAVGATYDRRIERKFGTPICVRPGEFIATTVRFRVGTATASQELTYVVSFDGYWE